VRAWCDRAGDFRQMQSMAAVCRMQDEPAPFLGRADGAEDVGRARPLIVRCDGRVPRHAQRLVILFFCPIRASSWNQISIGFPRISLRDLRQADGELFLNASSASVFWHDAGDEPTASESPWPQFPAECLFAD